MTITTSSPRSTSTSTADGDQVVGLPSGEVDLLDPERVEHLADEAHLLAQDVGRRLAVGLVVGVGVVAERGLGTVEGDQHAVGLLLLEHEDQHRREPEHGVGDLPAGGRHVGRQGEEGAVGQRVAVDEEVSYGHSPLPPISVGPQRAVEDPLGDVAHACALAHRRALDERERLGLLHPALVHQQPLGAVDQLARLELLAERVDLAGEVAQLAEAPDRDLDRRDQVALLERLDEVGQGAGVARLLDHLALAEGGEDQHAAQLLGGDDAGRLEPVDARHLDVEDRQVGLQLADQLDRLVAAAGLADDHVALLLEGLAEVHADDGLVLGDHDSKRQAGILSAGGNRHSCRRAPFNQNGVDGALRRQVRGWRQDCRR